MKWKFFIFSLKVFTFLWMASGATLPILTSPLCWMNIVSQVKLPKDHTILKLLTAVLRQKSCIIRIKFWQGILLNIKTFREKAGAYISVWKANPPHANIYFLLVMHFISLFANFSYIHHYHFVVNISFYLTFFYPYSQFPPFTPFPLSIIFTICY